MSSNWDGPSRVDRLAVFDGFEALSLMCLFEQPHDFHTTSAARRKICPVCGQHARYCGHTRDQMIGFLRTGLGPIDAAEELKRRAIMAPDKAETGQKLDQGKLPVELLPTRPLEAVARVLAFGARKYAPNNWRKGIAYSRVYAAVIRHCWLWWRGENIDADSGEHHLACAACELLFLLEYELSPNDERRARLDDRTANDIA